MTFLLTCSVENSITQDLINTVGVSMPSSAAVVSQQSVGR